VSTRRSALVWLGLAVILAVALAFSVRSGPQTPAQRAAYLDSIIKCPSCDGISVADSSAATAAAVRQDVATQVRAGRSNAQIEQSLVNRYGPSILLRPPTTGITAVVWIVPLVAAAGGLGGLGIFFWRRRRPLGVRVSSEDRALVERALVDRAGPDGSEGGAPSGGPGR
jgi:cytochrome c-type biogenesis protein CcmH